MATEDRPKGSRPPAKRPPSRRRPASARSVAPEPAPLVERVPAIRRRKVVLAGVALGLITVVAAILVVSRGGERAAAPSGTPAGSCQTDTTSDPGTAHVQSPTYAVNPPSGGNHEPIPAPAGRYSTGGIVPADGQLVHSLEHGYVVVWYRPDLADTDMGALAEVVSRFARDVLLVPRFSLKGRVAATAWHQRLLCERVEPAELSRFIDDYRNKGPERIPH